MKRVGIFLLLARCHRVENHQRQQRELAKKERSLAARSERSDQAKRAARPGPTRAPHYRGARRRAAREAEKNVAALQQSCPSGRGKARKWGLSGGGNHAKAEAQATTPHSLGWGLGRLRSE
jgi:hypothetical protein